MMVNNFMCLCLSQIQRLKSDKKLRVEDVINQPPDYNSISQRIKLFVCGIIMLICTIIFATITLYSIFSKIFDLNINDDTIKSVSFLTNYHDKIRVIIDFLINDWHYCLLIPILIPWSVILGWFGWIGFKLYRHN